MKTIIIGGVLKFQNSFKEFNGVVGLKDATDQQWYDWGFREYIPAQPSSLQKIGGKYLDVINDVYTDYLINKTQLELDQEQVYIEANLIAIQQGKKLEIVNTKLVEQIEEALSNPAMTPAEVISNLDFYDYWSGDSVSYGLNKTVKLISGELYRCIQAHTSQAGWSPEIVPALFTHIVPPGTVGVFVQPTGAQDAYQIGDKVHFPTITDPIYESKINANVWSPTGYPAGWKLA